MVQSDSSINNLDSILQSTINLTDSIISDTNTVVVDTIDVIIPKESANDILGLIPINQINNQWIFFWLAVIGILVFLSKFLYPKQFKYTILALFSNREYNNLQNESISWKLPINVYLIIAYVLSVSIILYIYSLQYQNQLLFYQWDITDPIKISLLISTLFITKLIIVIITRIIFQIKDLLTNYLNYLFISYNLLGVTLFFTLWILIYSNTEWGIYISISIISIIYIIRLFKFLTLCNSKNNFNLFHFIIYLCTVEILPVILFRKLYFIWFLNL